MTPDLPTAPSTRRLRATFRASALGALACALAATFLTLTAPSAQAFEQEGIFLPVDGRVSVDFAGIPGNNASGEAQDNETCKTSTYCDTIPVTIERDPTVGPDDEYFVVVTVSWDTAKAPPDPVLAPSEGFATNDMDTYMYQSPTDDTRHVNEDGEDYMAHSAGSEEPEQFFMFKPFGTYELVVINFLGVNQGYTVEMVWVSEAFDAPFESLAPGFTPPPTTAPATTTTTTTTVPAATAAPTTTVAPPVTLAPTEIALGTADDGFAQFSDDGDFDDQLAAPSPVDLTPVSAIKPPPPSTMALFFWFLALPLALVAAVTGVLLRRRASMVAI